MSQDDELFQDLEDYSALDESPTFDFEEDPFAEEDEPRAGVSRTFKIVGGILMLLVLGIVGGLIALAFSGDDDLSPNEMTSTAVIQTNTAVAIALDNTVTAVALAEQATREAIMTFEYNATQTEIAFQTQSAQATLEAGQTATAEFQAGQTATAQAATQAALDAAMTATENAARTIHGQLITEDGTVFGNVGIRLYRDDGDGVFIPPEGAVVMPLTSVQTTPESPAVAPEEGAADVADESTLSYGETVESTLTGGEPDLWFFTGVEGDLITITTEAGEPEQMDLFLELLGPDDEFLIDDDDSGGDFNAAIVDYALPADGRYTISVDSVAAPGPYTLTLELSSEEGAAEDEAAPSPGDASGYHGLPPFVRVAPIQASGRLPQAGSTPTMEPDEFITSVITSEEGTFDFGALEPGIYWLELDYEIAARQSQSLGARSDRGAGVYHGRCTRQRRGHLYYRGAADRNARIGAFRPDGDGVRNAEHHTHPGDAYPGFAHCNGHTGDASERPVLVGWRWRPGQHQRPDSVGDRGDRAGGGRVYCA